MPTARTSIGSRTSAAQTAPRLGCRAAELCSRTSTATSRYPTGTSSGSTTARCSRYPSSTEPATRSTGCRSARPRRTGATPAERAAVRAPARRRRRSARPSPRTRSSRRRSRLRAIPACGSTHMSAPDGRGRNTSSGADVPARRSGGNRDLRCSLEPLFDARPGDDVVAVAEAEGRLQRTLLVPEMVETGAQTLQLSGGGWVVPLGEDVPQLRSPLAFLLDLLMDVGQVHVS